MAGNLYPDLLVREECDAGKPAMGRALQPIPISKLFPHGKPIVDHEYAEMLRMLALCAHQIAVGLDQE